ncbi:MAG: cytidylate kinase-like family protein [Lachnospiraceae bacterium]|nr:cytidylate kinase-like family protein [Lachnospiraceae bacterium]
MGRVIITIARGYGSGGKTIGKMLSRELGISYYDRNLLREASEDSGIAENLFGLNDEKVKMRLFKKKPEVSDEPLGPEDDRFVSDDNLFNIQAKKIREIAEREDCVIVGRCGDYVLRGRDDVIRVFIYAPRKACIKVLMDMYGVSPKEAERSIEETDRERSTYYKHYTGHEWDDATNYDLCLNSAQLGFEKCVQMIKEYIRIKNQ